MGKWITALLLTGMLLAMGSCEILVSYISIVNDSANSITEVNIVKQGDPWGSNLASTPIAPGASRTFPVSTGNMQVRVIDDTAYDAEAINVLCFDGVTLSLHFDGLTHTLTP